MDNLETTENSFTTASEHHDYTLKLIQDAHKTIYIYCHDLTPRIYSHPDIAEALTKFIISNSLAAFRLKLKNKNIIKLNILYG